MSKLTLSVNESVVSRAKRYARENGVSVSEMVETYLAVVSRPPASDHLPPLLRSVRGSLKRADLADYRKHLARKYR